MPLGERGTRCYLKTFSSGCPEFLSGAKRRGYVRFEKSVFRIVIFTWVYLFDRESVCNDDKCVCTPGIRFHVKGAPYTLTTFIPKT